MILLEFYTAPPEGWQDVKDDNSQPKWKESRKATLMLSEINKIRRMNEVQAYEKAKDMKKIRKQYSPPAAGAPTL